VTTPSPSKTALPSDTSAHRRQAASRPQRQVLSWVLLLAAIALFSYHSQMYWQWTEDDAFISLQYARNLTEGHGLVFNPGERVEGYSNFSWVILASVVMKAGGDPLVWIKVFGLLAGMGCLVLSWVLVRLLVPGVGLLALLAPWYLAVSPVLTQHSTSGLESSMFAFLLIASLVLAAPSRTLRLAERGLLVLLLVLLGMTRPEGAAVALVLLLVRAASLGRAEGSGWQRSLLQIRGELAGFLLLFVIWYAWRWNYFGLPFPNTFYAKAQGGLHSIIDGTQYTLDFLRDGGGPIFFGVGFAPLLAGRMRPVTWMALGILTTYLAFVVIAGGDWMWNYRFFSHVIPVIAALTAAGFEIILAKSSAGSWRTLGLYSALSLLLLTTMVGMANTEMRMARIVLPAIRSHNYLSQNYEELGVWLKENTDADVTVAISDVGAIAYYSERRILDMFGLNDRHIAAQKGRMHYKADPSYVLSKKPEIIILLSLNDQGDGYSFQRVPDYAINALPEFHEQYQLIRTVPQHWQNEFALIYQRQPIQQKGEAP